MSLTSITSLWFVVKLDLHCHFSIFFFLLKLIFAEKGPLSVPNFTSAVLKMNSPPSLSSSNYFSHSAWISWCFTVACMSFFLFCLTTVLSPPKEMQPFASLCGRHFFFSVLFFKLEFWLSVCCLSFFIFYWHVRYTCIVTDHSVIGTWPINNNKSKGITCLGVVWGGDAAVTGLINRKWVSIGKWPWGKRLHGQSWS